MNRKDPKQIREEWSLHAATALAGRKIIQARYPDDEDRENGVEGLMLFLDDGLIWVVNSDDEGNGPGALAMVGTLKRATKKRVAEIHAFGGILPVVP